MLRFGKVRVLLSEGNTLKWGSHVKPSSNGITNFSVPQKILFLRSMYQHIVEIVATNETSVDTVNALIV
jgi:hypothetical protein